jgi:asparagine synthase (glutamine-hydrolysing)
MCGIVGFAGFTEPGLLARMCNAVAHRGPDGEGMAELAEARISIGMRRLAIIDLATGDQPFVSADRRVQLVFNGEIYNFRELREELRELGHAFNTQSDTEVVLVSYLQWGNDAWQRLHGMFAIAIADLRGAAPELVVVRDRVGMKPVYFMAGNGRLVFASEIKALTVWSGFSNAVDPSAILDYLALRYVPGPGSLLKHVRKLPAGHVLRFRNGSFSLARWWTPPNDAPTAEMDDEEAAERFGAAFRNAIRRHLVSDVPVGAFLSGGIDSNSIVALMAEMSPGRVKTFSIGFPDFPDAEMRRAELAAQAFQTDHHPIECRASDMANLSDIAWSLDEPVGDAIVVPMYVLAREAHRKVKVVLSGEGADEILGGYLFHRKLVQLETMRQRIPACLWRLAAAVVGRTPVGMLNRWFDYPGKLGSDGRRKVAYFLAQTGSASLMQLYRESISLFDRNDLDDSLAPTFPAHDVRQDGSELDEAAGEGTPLQRLIRAQYQHWLPDDILMKTDKMTMAHSLEARIPFMDEEVIRAAARTPDRHKLAPDVNKKILRDFAKRTLLPPELVNTPKMAFYIPLESYIETPIMRDVMRRTLDPERIRRRGLFRPEWIDAARNSSPAAGFLPLKRLFSIVMLELWFERFCPEASWA